MVWGHLLQFPDFRLIEDGDTYARLYASIFNFIHISYLVLNLPLHFHTYLVRSVWQVTYLCKNVSSENPDLQALRILRMPKRAQIAWMVCGPLPVVAEVALPWPSVSVLVLETCTKHGFLWIFRKEYQKQWKTPGCLELVVSLLKNWEIVRRCSSANFADMFCMLSLLNAEVCCSSWPSLVFHSLFSWA